MTIKIDNILLFRDVLKKRMDTLKVRVESKKIPKGKPLEKKLTDKDISLMKIEMIKKTIDILVDKIEKNDLSFYNVNTFMVLCGKAVEYYSANNDQSHMRYLDLMKKVLLKPEVQKVVYGNNDNTKQSLHKQITPFSPFR